MEASLLCTAHFDAVSQDEVWPQCRGHTHGALGQQEGHEENAELDGPVNGANLWMYPEM